MGLSLCPLPSCLPPALTITTTAGIRLPCSKACNIHAKPTIHHERSSSWNQFDRPCRLPGIFVSNLSDEVSVYLFWLTFSSLQRIMAYNYSANADFISRRNGSDDDSSDTAFPDDTTGDGCGQSLFSHNHHGISFFYPLYSYSKRDELIMILQSFATTTTRTRRWTTSVARRA
jgi:hypothetical protein